MGLFRRRTVEKARQKGNMGNKDFDVTRKTRVAHTYDELKDFAEHLKTFQTASDHHLKSVRDFNRSTKEFLRCKLPRRHEETRPGESRVLDRTETVGQGADMFRLSDASAAREDTIFHDAQEPIRKWLLEFDRVTKDMSSLEKQRLLQDSRRRSVQQLDNHVTKMRQRHASDHPKLVKKMDDKHRQDVKLQQTQEEFDGKEEAVFKEMEALVEKSRGVQSHIVKFHDHIRETHEDIVTAFNNHQARLHGGKDNVTPMTHGNLPTSVVTPVHNVQPTTAGNVAPVKQVMSGTGTAQQVGGTAGTHVGGTAGTHVGVTAVPASGVVHPKT